MTEDIERRVIHLADHITPDNDGGRVPLGRRIFDEYHRTHDTHKATTGAIYAGPKNAGGVVDPLQPAGQFARRFIDSWNTTHEKQINERHVRDLVMWVHGRVLNGHHGEPVTVAIRAADMPAHRDRPRTVVVDLGGHGPTPVAVVTADGWTLTDRGPALFRRSPSSNPIKYPTRPADGVNPGHLLDDYLAELLNVSEDSRRLIIGWLMAVYLDIARPMLWLGGEHGTGKSTAARLLARLVDPHGTDGLRQVPDRPDRFLPVVNSAHLIAFDNIGHIPRWLSDLLSAAVTGVDVEERLLFNNADMTVSYFLRKAFIITAIDADGGAADMVSRLLPVALEYVPEHRRLNEKQLRAKFQANRPAMFGALLDLIAVYLATPAGEHVGASRFPDFDDVLAALDNITGWTTRTDYLTATRNIQAELVKGDPVATAVVSIVETNAGQWTGTTAQLLTALETHRPDDTRGWPTNERALGRRLTKISPALRAAGVNPTRRRGRDASMWSFTTGTDDDTTPDRFDI